MQIRAQLSIALLLIASVMLLLPGSGKYSFIENPDSLVESLFDDEIAISVDQVAKLMVAEDSTIQLIDLRSVEEYSEHNIPGAINIPFEEFFEQRPENYLYNKSLKYIFYSNSETHSGYAVTLAHGLGYSNSYYMIGGLNEWFRTVMLTSFSGDNLTPRENALFENRSRAKRFFVEINSLPDSLKLQYAESRRQAERDLDGGCE